MSTYDYDIAQQPNYLDFLNVGAGYGVLSCPIDGLLYGDVVQAVTLTIQPSTGSGTTIQRSVDMVQRTYGYFEWVTQESIAAHFTLLAADIAVIAAGTFKYSISALVTRNGNAETREVQSGAIQARTAATSVAFLVATVTVSPNTIDDDMGETAQLTATAYDGLGNVVVGQTITWASTNTGIATVNSSGLVTLVAGGSCTITATVQGIVGACQVTVQTTGLNKQVVGYLSADSLWAPRSLDASWIGAGTFAGAMAFAVGAVFSSTVSLGGIVYTFPASQSANKVLRTDGAGVLSWGAPTEEIALTELTDVTITSVATGQFLQKSAGDWVNHTLVTADVSDLTTASTGITKVGTVATGVWQATAIADTYLATISTAGKVANSATTAASANTASAIVARDGSGNFTAGTITASLTGAVTGNASTATALQTPRTINGTSFNGTADITVTAAAGTLTGTTLNATVVSSSLTSVGVLASPHMTGAVVDSGGFTVTSGTTALQATTVTSLTASALVTASAGLTVASGQTLTVTGATITGAPTWGSSQAITLSTAAQPNVTSVGTLTSLSAGAITTTGNLTITKATPTLILTNTASGSKQWQLFGSGNNFFIEDTGTGNALQLTAGGGAVFSAGAAFSGALSGITTLATSSTATIGSTLTVTAGGLTVSSGTTAVQGLTATTGAFTGVVGVSTAGVANRSLTVGYSSSAHISLLNQAGNAATFLNEGGASGLNAFQIAPGGSVKFTLTGTGQASFAGAVDGITTLSVNGTLSLNTNAIAGVTTLSGSGAVSGFTTIGISQGIGLSSATAPTNGIAFGTSAPGSLANGQLWYDATDFKARTGGATKTVVLS